MNALVAQRHLPSPRPDHFSELSPDEYKSTIAEATVLARLGGLLHDVCHVPFGHTLEDDLGILVPHDENNERFDRIWADLNTEGLPSELVLALKPLIISKSKDEEATAENAKYPFVHDIVGNTICADLLDYLLRDHASAGLPLQLGDRFLSAFFVTPKSEILYPRRVAVGLNKTGLRRTDVESELLKCLRYRYELDERVLTHHAKLAADAMLGKLFSLHFSYLWASAYREHNPSDPNLATALTVGSIRQNLGSSDPSKRRELDDSARSQLESLVLAHGDDGLLEALAAEGWGRDLANDLLNRKLYRLLAQTRDLPRANALHTNFGKPRQRLTLESECANYFEFSPSSIALWVPKPRMRMKPAGVLVDYDATGNSIARLHDVDATRSGRATEIYQSHADLWRVAVYVHRDIIADPSRSAGIKAWLSGRMANVAWDGWERESIARAAQRQVSGPPQEILHAAFAGAGATGSWETLKAQVKVAAELAKEHHHPENSVE